MRKNTRRLLCAAAAVVVLGGIYAGLMLRPAQDDTADTPSVSLISIESGKLASVHITLRGGEDYTMNVATDDSGTAYTMSGEISDYSQSLMEALMDAARTVSARPVTEDCEELEKYGLSADDETDTVVITDTSGTAVTLTLGLVSDTLGTYCTVDGGNDVYLLENTAAQSLTQPQTYYRNLTILGSYYNLSSELQTLSIDCLSDGSSISISARDTSNLDDDAVSAYSNFVFTAPTACDADDTDLSNGLLSSLQSGLTAQSIVEDQPSDLSKYGLDDPVRIHLTANNLDAAILVGDKDDDGGIYVMEEGGATVFLCTASDYAFLDADWNDWRSTNLMPCALSQIDSITIVEDDMVSVVDITHVEAEENEEDDTDTTTATCNGDDMTDDALQKLFLAVTSVNYTRLVDNPQPANAEITVTLTLTDATERTLSFAKGGSREYLVSVDGGGYAYGVPQDDVTSILDALTTDSDN